jgi:hypothetical protein
MKRGVVVLVALAACRTVSSGADERTDALLADYRSRLVRPVPASEISWAPDWRSGEYTVHALTKDRLTVLERVSVWRQPAQPRVRVSVDRLGARERLRVRLTLSRVPTEGERLDGLVLEAWVRREDRPEMHHLGEVPKEVVALVSAAIERPRSDSSPRTLTVPAGEFEGCVGGVHGAVPLSGVVRQTREGVLRELLEFGDDDSGWLY